jgi:pyridoxamine 5'-phosphate oxidase
MRDDKMADRKDRASGLRRVDLDPDPFKQFDAWYQQAMSADLILPDAMIVATATREGRPSARFVLLKEFDERGFVFYTNYESRKAREMDENPYVSLVFYWAELDRQVRITGRVSKVPREVSERYFQTRPLESQLGAWASRQSRAIKNRDVLEDALNTLIARYRGKHVPLPPFWGGYRVSPDSFEFWQSRPGRLHDRFLYEKRGDDWLIERLSP